MGTGYVTVILHFCEKLKFLMTLLWDKEGNRKWSCSSLLLDGQAGILTKKYNFLDLFMKQTNFRHVS